MDLEKAGQVIGRILEDYKQDRDIDRMGQAKEPDKDEIVALIGQLRRIVFPFNPELQFYRYYCDCHCRSGTGNPAGVSGQDGYRA